MLVGVEEHQSGPEATRPVGQGFPPQGRTGASRAPGHRVLTRGTAEARVSALVGAGTHHGAGSGLPCGGASIPGTSQSDLFSIVVFGFFVFLFVHNPLSFQ